MNPEIIAKLSGMPEKSRQSVVAYTDKLVDGLMDNLVSVVLFGSAADGDFIEGKSDINILIVLESARTIELNIIMDTSRKFIKANLAVPLVFEKNHIATSLDTFPIEFSDMKKRHVTLYGKDPLDGAVIESKNLRYQCERELKSIVVNLRRGFLRANGKKENIEALLEGSLSSALAACRGLIWLAGKTPPYETGALLATVEESYGLNITFTERVWKLRQGESGATATLEALLDDYIDEIDALAAAVDRL